MEGLLSNNLVSKASIFGAGGSNIKSIQVIDVAITTETSKDTAITAVDINKTIVIMSTHKLVTPSTSNLFLAKLTSTTVLNLSRLGSGNLSGGVIRCYVIELQNVKSIQIVEKTISNSSYNYVFTQAINTVNLLKTLIFYTHKNNNANSAPSGLDYRVYLSTASQLTFEVFNPALNEYFHCYVVEFN